MRIQARVIIEVAALADPAMGFPLIPVVPGAPGGEYRGYQLSVDIVEAQYTVGPGEGELKLRSARARGIVISEADAPAYGQQARWVTLSVSAIPEALRPLEEEMAAAAAKTAAAGRNPESS